MTGRSDIIIFFGVMLDVEKPPCPFHSFANSAVMDTVKKQVTKFLVENIMYRAAKKKTLQYIGVI